MPNARLRSVTIFATLALASPTLAGPSNTPLPLLRGQKAKHVYTVPGVMHSSTLATFFSCNVVDRKGVDWGVEIFNSIGQPDNDLAAGNGDGGIEAGETGTITTAELAAFEEAGDVIAGVSQDARPRSARILATSAKLICSATVTDRSGNPPSVAYGLPVIRKTAQKGD